MDDISPTKLKALKAARNGRNGDGPVDDDSSNHKNGDEHVHDDDDEDDDDVCVVRDKFEEKKRLHFVRFLGSRW